MNRNFGAAGNVWQIMYPVGMYYVAITMGSFLAQLFLGTSNETYMLCKIIGSLVAIPVVYTEYKSDLCRAGVYGKKPKLTWNTAYCAGMAMLISACISISLNNIISMSPLMRMSSEYQSASNAFYGSTLAVEFLGSAIITPILEEMLHRGVVYKRLRQMMQMWQAVVLSALIFAVLHFNIVQFIYAFLLGIVFALLVERTGHIYPAVLGHMIANGIAVIRTETGFLAQTVDGSLLAWLIAFSLLLLGIALGKFFFLDSFQRSAYNK